MGLYRKKPVVIEARQTREDTVHDVLLWIRACGSGANFGAEPGSLEIVTLEGVMVADVGDFVIKGVQEEFYPCKPGIFAETYEPLAAPVATEGGQS